MLTEDQKNKLAESKRQTRPAYYDAVSRQSITIGEDLEAFLILLNDDLREELIDRLGFASVGDPDVQTLYQESLTAEQLDTSVVLSQYDSILASYDAFRDRVSSSPFATSIEVAPMMQDVQRGVGVYLENRNRHFHSLQIARTLQTLKSREDGNDDTQLQRDSWANIIGVYR